MSLTRKEIITLVAIACGSFPAMQERNPEPIVNAWENVLPADMTFDLAKAAVVKVCQTSRFFPTPADIINSSQEILSDITGRTPTAEEAWEEVMEAVDYRGKYTRYWESGKANYDGPTKFSHPLIERAVKTVGGVHSLRNSESIGVERAHFMKIYASFDAREAITRQNEIALNTSGLIGEKIRQLAESKKMIGGKDS